jgi:hypothetical protein
LGFDVKFQAVGGAEFVDRFLYAGKVAVAVIMSCQNATGTEEREIVGYVVAATLVGVIAVDEDKVDCTNMGHRQHGCSSNVEVAVPETGEAAQHIIIQVIEDLLGKIHRIVVALPVEIGVDADQATEGGGFEKMLGMAAERNANLGPCLQRHRANNFREMWIAAPPGILVIAAKILDGGYGIHVGRRRMYWRAGIGSNAIKPLCFETALA